MTTTDIAVRRSSVVATRSRKKALRHARAGKRRLGWFAWFVILLLVGGFAGFALSTFQRYL